MENKYLMNTTQEIPKPPIEAAATAETIRIELADHVDVSQSVIVVNGEPWNGEPIDVHDARRFEIEFSLVDPNGEPIQAGVLDVEGDKEPPVFQINVPDELLLTEDMLLDVRAESEDLARIQFFVDGVEYKKRELVLTPAMREVRVVAHDRAGNTTEQTIQIEPLVQPILHIRGAGIEIEHWRDGFTLWHNGEEKAVDEARLVPGTNTFEIRSDALLEPLVLEPVEYKPEPVTFEASWEDDTLHFALSRPVKTVRWKIGETMYDNVDRVEWGAQSEGQTVRIEAEMTDLDDQVFFASQTVSIPAIQAPLPLPTPKPQPQPQPEPQPDPVDFAAARPVLKPPLDPFKPIEFVATSSLKSEAILEKTFRLDDQKQLDVAWKKEPAIQTPRLEIVDESLVPASGRFASEKVRIVLADTDPARVESIRVNGKAVSKDALEQDRLQQAYFEIDTAPDQYVVDIAYRDADNQIQTLRRDFEVEAPAPKPAWAGGWALLLAPVIWLGRWLWRHV